MGLRSLKEVPLPEPHPVSGSERPDGTRPSGFLRRQGSLAGCVLYRATGADYRHYRSQRGGQDHLGPVSVRFDEGTKRYDSLGRKASGPNGKKAEGVPDHAGCEPPAFWRQRAGGDPAGKYGHRAGGFDRLGAEWIWLSMRILTPWLYPAGRSRGWPSRMAASAGKELLIFRRAHQRAGPRPHAGGEPPAPGAGGAGPVRAGHHPRRGVPAGERRPSRFLAVGGMTS